ncbi:hypothetical protein MKW98_031865 [Papaver atlanticum]|uniref:Uncharacterized protein n=1 Tax=Papaver atlanticum TaxID=357466 RepID=A0AAD4XD46_9MAGN|nr:hypothetical protein MKW98_031865 [Papaver atlanticum]
MLLSNTVRKFHESINYEWDFLQRMTKLLSQYYGHIQNGNVSKLTWLFYLWAWMQGAYRLSCLKESKVFEVDFPKLLQMKATLLQLAMISTNEKLTVMVKSLTRVAADIRDDDWLEKLQRSGYLPERNTVWVLEGILHYLSHQQAMQVLNIIAANCNQTHTVLLADFMNKSSTTLSQSNFQFYNPDAHFGLMHDPFNLFNRLRKLPRSMQTNQDDNKPCCRLYLASASGSPDKNRLEEA